MSIAVWQVMPYIAGNTPCSSDGRGTGGHSDGNSTMPEDGKLPVGGSDICGGDCGGGLYLLQRHATPRDMLYHGICWSTKAHGKGMSINALNKGQGPCY
jgi:hypothetical protein